MQPILHILTRVSSTIQKEDGYGLDAQLSEGKFVAEMLGFGVKHWDEGAVSSSTNNLTSRPVMTQLLLEVQDHQIEHLYVYGYDRLWRNDEVFSNYKIYLFKAGIKIYTGRNPHPADLSDPKDKLMLNMMSSFAIFDNELRTERFRLGKLKSVSVGGWKGGPPPYGYELVDKKLVVSEKEAFAVQKIFESYADGASFSDIKKVLMSDGVLTRRGNVTWTDGSIIKLLTNTHHNGYWQFTDGKTDEKLIVNCPRTVDEHLYLKVQNEIKKRSYKAFASKRTREPNQKKTTLLSDVLFCAHCNARWNVQNRKNDTHSNYFCSNKKSIKRRTEKMSAKQNCDVRRSINRQLTDEFVWNALVKTLSESATYKETVKQAALGETSYSASKLEAKKLKLKVKKLDKQIGDITDSIIELEIKKRTEDRNEDEVNRIIKGMDERRLEMQLQSTEIHKQIVGDGKGREWVDWVKKFEKKIDDLRDNAWDTETKKEFLNGFVETIHVKQIDKRLVNLLISFKMPFVNDAIRYKGYSQKPKKYDVISGASDIELEVDFIEKKLLKINAV